MSQKSSPPYPSPTVLAHLRLRTEHSYNYAVGKMEEVLDLLPADLPAAITDRDGTWGHIRWYKECKKRERKAILGVELGVVGDMEVREKQPTNYMVFLARNSKGLRELYEITSLATEKFYYTPRLDYPFLRSISGDIAILSGAHPEWDKLPKKLSNLFVELSPLSGPYTAERAAERGLPTVATGDNLYPTPEDRGLYHVVIGERRQQRTAPSHILNYWEWLAFWPEHADAVTRTAELARDCAGVELPQAEMVHPKIPAPLRQMCRAGAKVRGVNLQDPVYKARLDRELKLIDEKGFADYFHVVQDMIAWAKERMFVGPARGSSCGSLVCYLVGITDIDPIPFDLLFERFIDVNREDFPDIDIDFQDDKRELVFDYLRDTYGHDRVARLGTINVFKAKSALSIASKELQVPAWEITDLKNAIVERSSGDSRATFCILDTFQELEIGRQTLGKYPELAVSARMEGHASHTGMHAAGILITAHPITSYCSINHHTGAAMIDKKDAESINLLKIDALGLRTLSVLADCLKQIGWSVTQLQQHPLDDQRAFDIINESHYAGVFQYEGYALQSLAKQFRLDRFEDVAVITALARPGPMNSGGASDYVRRRSGKDPVKYFHPLMEPFTKLTFGTIVYQEQVMQIARGIGRLSWKEVAELRIAMSRNKGEEYFRHYQAGFRVGAQEQGMSLEDADGLWEQINTFGSWAFNRSHAVAYGMMSYWCCVLKAHYPLEFAAACLRNAKDDEQSVKILRELVIEGYQYQPYNRQSSLLNWSVQGGQLVGGLTGIKGVGAKLGAAILLKREKGLPFSPREEKLLTSGETPWDKVFECAERWGHVIAQPALYGIESALTTLDKIDAESDGTFVFIARLTAKVPRDHNELQSVQKRGGAKMSGPTAYLNLTLEDDTSAILANISRRDYAEWAVPIIEGGKIGDWYIWKGQNRRGFRRIYVKRYKKLSGVQEFMKNRPKDENSSRQLPEDRASSNPSAGESAPAPKPKSRKTNMKASKSSAPTSSKKNTTGEVSPTDENPTGKSPKPSAMPKKTRDIDIKKATDGELLAWYNENSGSKKALKKFESRLVAEAKCAELDLALTELAGGSSKASATKAAAKAAKAPKAPVEKKAPGEGAPRGRKSEFAGKHITRATEGGANPRREGTNGFRSFELIDKKKGVSYEDYIAGGGRAIDLAWDLGKGYVTVK